MGRRTRGIVPLPRILKHTVATGAALVVPVDQRPEVLRRFGGPAGTVVVVVLPTCPCSRSHEPVLERLAKRYDQFGFVGLRSAEAPSAEYFGRRALPFPVVAAPRRRPCASAR
jgi:hypothetical protein